MPDTEIEIAVKGSSPEPDDGTYPTTEEQYGEARSKLEKSESSYEIEKSRNEEIKDKIMERILNRVDPAPPDLMSVPKPKLQLSKGFIIASMALLTASVAGASYMRLGARGAMSALTAAIDGLREGKRAQYDQSMKEYNAKLNLMIQQSKVHNTEFDRIMRDENKTLQEKIIEGNRIERMYDNANRQYQHTIEGLNRLRAQRDNLMLKIKNQAFIRNNKLTTMELQYNWIVGELSRETGKPIGEIRKMYRPYEFAQDIHPDTTIKRTINKKKLIEEFPGLKYGIKTKDDLPDPTSLPEGQAGTTSEGYRLVVQNGKWVVSK